MKKTILGLVAASVLLASVSFVSASDQGTPHNAPGQVVIITPQHDTHNYFRENINTGAVVSESIAGVQSFSLGTVNTLKAVAIGATSNSVADGMPGIYDLKTENTGSPIQALSAVGGDESADVLDNNLTTLAVGAAANLKSEGAGEYTYITSTFNSSDIESSGLVYAKQGAASGNTIDTTAIGASTSAENNNASMYSHDSITKNDGNVMAVSHVDTWDGNVIENNLSSTAIGSSFSMSSSNVAPVLP